MTTSEAVFIDTVSMSAGTVSFSNLEISEMLLDEKLNHISPKKKSPT